MDTTSAKSKNEAIQAYWLVNLLVKKQLLRLLRLTLAPMSPKAMKTAMSLFPQHGGLVLSHLHHRPFAFDIHGCRINHLQQDLELGMEVLGTKSLSQYNGLTEIKPLNFYQQTLQSNQHHFAELIWSPLVLWQMQYSAAVLQPGHMISCIHTLPGLHAPHTKGSFVITLVPPRTQMFGLVGLIWSYGPPNKYPHPNKPGIPWIELIQKAACFCSEAWLFFACL